MRIEKQLGIGLLSVGLVFGWAGRGTAQDAAPAADQAKSEPAQDAPAPQQAGGEGRGEGREGRGGGRRGMDPQRMLERLQASFADLNLSDEQKTRIQAIVDKAKPQLEAAAKEAEGQEPRQRMEKLRAVAQPVREEMMGVLDQTQRDKLRANMEAARAARGPGGGGPGGRPAMMMQRLKESLAQLELTAEQKPKVDELLAASEKQMAELRAEADKSGQPPRGKMRELMQSNRQKLNEILTEEQRTKLRELMPPPQRRDGQGGRGGQGGADGKDGAPREPL